MAREIEVKIKTDSLLRNVNNAVMTGVGRACDFMIKQTKFALNTTGPNKALQKAFGINKKDGPHSFDAGLVGISGLKFIGLGKKNRTVAHGGTFTDDKGGQHDGMYFYGEPLNKWVQASPVGKPPHAQSRALRDSIDKQLDYSKMSGRVGPRDELVYARRQELGGPGSYPARPYLRPTLMANRAAIGRILIDVVKRRLK